MGVVVEAVWTDWRTGTVYHNLHLVEVLLVSKIDKAASEAKQKRQTFNVRRKAVHMRLPESELDDPVRDDR